MTDSVKILGQSIPSAGVLTNIYTVPASTSATISSITICNQGGSPTNFRISVAVGGAADNTKQYIYYDLYLDASDTFIATAGITLAATDVVRVKSNNGNVSFNLFGVEVS